MKGRKIRNLKSELESSERKLLRLQRKKLFEEAEPEDLSLWVMLDLMTLILVFFILLYLNQFSEHSPVKSLVKMSPPVLSSKIMQNLPHQSRDKIHEANNAALFKIKNKIDLAMQEADDSNYKIVKQKDRIVLTVGEQISFKEGQASLLNHIKQPLNKISQFLNKDYTIGIVISGHTDDTPIHTEKFPSNWELSVARALAVAKYLIGNQVDPERILVQGYGQYKPIADNYYYKGRQANRRVEISLVLNQHGF